jgi:hypothetical protein
MSSQLGRFPVLRADSLEPIITKRLMQPRNADVRADRRLATPSSGANSSLPKCGNYNELASTLANQLQVPLTRPSWRTLACAKHGSAVLPARPWD